MSRNLKFEENLASKMSYELPLAVIEDKEQEA